MWSGATSYIIVYQWNDKNNVGVAIKFKYNESARVRHTYSEIFGGPRVNRRTEKWKVRSFENYRFAVHVSAPICFDFCYWRAKFITYRCAPEIRAQSWILGFVFWFRFRSLTNDQLSICIHHLLAWRNLLSSWLLYCVVYTTKYQCVSIFVLCVCVQI